MMRNMCGRVALLVALVAGQAWAGDGDEAWKSLKGLAGVWEGANGKATLTYTVVSGGHAVMERLQPPGTEPEMITMYHRDGDALVATHYCSAGNQPRMRAAQPGAQVMEFKFQDITNVRKKGETHIKDLTLKLKDAEHLTQIWNGITGDKEEAMTFEWTRKK